MILLYNKYSFYIAIIDNSTYKIVFQPAADRSRSVAPSKWHCAYTAARTKLFHTPYATT